MFLYTQFAHQPDTKKERQFNECLTQINGSREALTCMFLWELWNRSIQIGNAGKFISWWFNAYCTAHGKQPAFLASLRDDHAGFGAVEKKEEQEARLFEQKLGEVALALWRQNGQPIGGPNQFRAMAQQQLEVALGAKARSGG